MSESIRVTSVTSGVSECDPIELMVSADSTRRLVFLPVIHDNPQKNGSVNGSFVYQRKRKADDWEKISNDGQSLSKLKAGEGYRLDLNTDAVAKMVNGLLDIDEIAEHVKKGRTNTTYVPTASQLAPLLKQLLENIDDETVLQELSKLGRENALRINDLVLNARIRSALKYWDEHKQVGDENNWQDFFNGRPWIISLICSEPIVILKDKMYLGGTNASGKGGKKVDYGLINRQTANTALLEIKTPMTVLLSPEYRGIYPPGRELTGSVTQVQNYKYNTLKNIREIGEEFEEFDAVNIPTYVLAGNTEQLVDAVRKRSFELYRKNLGSTIILGYDEVFERLKILLNR